jgi:peptide/nickel transport system permease protein
LTSLVESIDVHLDGEVDSGRRTSSHGWRTSIGLYTGLGFIVALLLAAWFLPLRYSPTTLGNTVLAPPSAQHWFGTNEAAQDMFARTIRATRTDLPLAFGGTALAAVVGVVGGLLAATTSRAAEWLMRFLDAFQALPLLIVTIAIVVIANNSLFMVAVAICLVSGPFYIRLIRSQALILRESRFVEASRAAGTSWPRLMARHVLPNLRGLILTQTANTAAVALLVVAAMSFIGVGVIPPTPSWGAMIRSGSEQLVNGQWWDSLFPSLALFGCIISFNLIADGLRDRSGRKRGMGPQ